jgi:uncharacterized protein YbjT (DUF2867 family)
MRVLLTGASGFIGRALAEALTARGHEVVPVQRRPPAGQAGIAADFAAVPPRDWWLERLAGVDAVVNAVGILRESPAQRFDALHAGAPAELFRACAEAGVRRVVQISALGADAQAQSRYHLSKRAADEVLRGLPLAGAIVQPSVVYGAGGSSAALFNRMAAAPLLPLPQGGEMAVQPVHLDDVVEGIVRLLEREQAAVPASTLHFAGDRPLTLRAYLEQLRPQLGYRSPLRVLALPRDLFLLAAALAAWLPGSLLDRETAGMLLRGNSSDRNALPGLLGRAPRPVERFVARQEAEPFRVQAALALWLPALRMAIALLWIWTGIVSLGLYPVEDSLALLARVGLHGDAARWALYGAAALDLLLGILTLVLPAGRRGLLWAGQLALMAGYTALITLFLPEQWLHPYGPISKNVPLALAIALVWALEPPVRRR